MSAWSPGYGTLRAKAKLIVDLQKKKIGFVELSACGSLCVPAVFIGFGHSGGAWARGLC
jgi:hypothetical protein